MTQGKVLEIHIYSQPRSPATSLPEVEAMAGVGLRGDHPRKERRHLTLLSNEAWDQALAEMGDDLPACTRRANLVVEGIDLRQTIGKRLLIGEVETLVLAETQPCDLMEQQRAGLRAALTPEMRGGVNGTIEVGGTIRVGDAVSVCE